MALSADEKEAIMSKRGETKTTGATGSKTTIYVITLICGKRATMLSMDGASLEEATKNAYDRFSKRRVVSVQPKS